MQRDEEEEDVLMNDVPIFDTERPHTQVTAYKYSYTNPETRAIEKKVLLANKTHVVNPKTREISQFLDTSLVSYGDIPKENPVRQNIKAMLQNQKRQTPDTYNEQMNVKQNRYYQNVLNNIDKPHARTTKIMDWKVPEETSLKPSFLEKSFKQQGVYRPHTPEFVYEAFVKGADTEHPLEKDFRDQKKRLATSISTISQKDQTVKRDDEASADDTIITGAEEDIKKAVPPEVKLLHEKHKIKLAEMTHTAGIKDQLAENDLSREFRKLLVKTEMSEGDLQRGMRGEMHKAAITEGHEQQRHQRDLSMLESKAFVKEEEAKLEHGRALTTLMSTAHIGEAQEQQRAGREAAAQEQKHGHTITLLDKKHQQKVEEKEKEHGFGIESKVLGANIKAFQQTVGANIEKEILEKKKDIDLEKLREQTVSEIQKKAADINLSAKAERELKELEHKQKLEERLAITPELQLEKFKVESAAKEREKQHDFEREKYREDARVRAIQLENERLQQEKLLKIKENIEERKGFTETVKAVGAYQQSKRQEEGMMKMMQLLRAPAAASPRYSGGGGGGYRGGMRRYGGPYQPGQTRPQVVVVAPGTAKVHRKIKSKSAKKKK